MTEDHSNEPWKELLATARKAGATGKTDTPGSASQSFVARVREMRSGLWGVAKAIFWRRWSLVAVGIALLIYLFFYLVLKEPSPRSITTPVPPEVHAP